MFYKYSFHKSFCFAGIPSTIYNFYSKEYFGVTLKVKPQFSLYYYSLMSGLILIYFETFSLFSLTTLLPDDFTARIHS